MRPIVSCAIWSTLASSPLDRRADEFGAILGLPQHRLDPLESAFGKPRQHLVEILHHTRHRTPPLHRRTGFETPTNAEGVKATMRGIRRTIGSAKQGKAPATADIIGAMLQLAPNTTIGLRDRALLCLGFAWALKRRRFPHNRPAACAFAISLWTPNLWNGTTKKR
jgi:hypothetical protein